MARNWCGWEGGFKFRTILTWLKKIPNFDFEKAESLYDTIEDKVCNPHDDRFTEWGGVIEFYKANYEFTENLLRELHWSTITGRAFIALISMFFLNTIWIKYFNWTKIV